MNAQCRTWVGVALFGAASLASAQTAAPAAASFADEYAAWQRLVSANPAYRAVAPDLIEPAADPIAHPTTVTGREALFRQEENAWQAASQSDTAPDSTPATAAASPLRPPHESLGQREVEFAQQEQSYQQLVSGNAMYRQPTSLTPTLPPAIAGSPARPAS